MAERDFFREDNTEGYTPAELDTMNEMFQDQIKDLDPEDLNYKSTCDYIGEQVELELEALQMKQSTPVRFELVGEEMVRKNVVAQGNSGRIYLPVSWVGREVAVVLLLDGGAEQ